MQSIQYSPRFLKHRRFLILLPLIVIPFLIVLFFILGGGRENEVLANNKTSGLNVHLPDAHFKQGNEKSKLSIYEEARRDSAILREKIKNDPYYPYEPHDTGDILYEKPDEMGKKENSIMEKLSQLKSVLHGKDELTPSSIHAQSPDRLLPPQYMKEAQSNIEITKTHNPVIDQLNTMLDKVMAIQHPELFKDSISKTKVTSDENIYHVNIHRQTEDAETFSDDKESEAKSTERPNRFFDLVQNLTIENGLENSLEAVVPETQTLVSGSTIKLRILNDIRINGHLIMKDQYIYGITTLNGERLKIQFSSLRSGNTILPVSLEAYDMDGLVGVFIPGSINRDVAKQSGDQALGAIGITTLDPSIGAQAAGAGIQAAKTLISRKVKLMKVTIKDGYRVLLKDSKQ